ncbi:MAG: c-type cytochrome biogenesis protein CcsB [Gammaproteobacteria bacterium]|nr:c-type cytochrome biogenesis protein CcsB [Gammaproteobacteria bacterium]MDX5375757.1 c-type cytochrome biogenesis protein CcsB [Gammaproteobacteria bacterium]
MSVPNEALSGLERESWIKRLSAFDWIWAVLVIIGTVWAYGEYHANMDVYEIGILFGTAPALIWLGWFWKPARPYLIVSALISLFALWLYGDDFGMGRTALHQLEESSFFLKFLISSQSAIMWMSALFVLSTVAYFLALFTSNEFTGKVATAITWSALTMGLVGMLVRWYESYLINPEYGHIPVSNLYEVFILFCLITGLMYLYYEGRYRSRALGGFVMLVISAAVAFLLWYHFTRDAHVIEPLVPALKSYWMKIHVPANFVGYGAFALAAMVGSAWLLKYHHDHPSRKLAVIVPVAIFLVIGGWSLATGLKDAELSAGLLLFAVGKGLAWAAGLSLIGWLSLRERAYRALPSLELMDDVMYRAIAVGFAFFTIATILGAMWAAEAWGGYWSWDPKETWALIVWLNYAAWLHMRFTKGWRGEPMAWWAIVGLFVTLFAFVGVNMFLSGLHSYGEL